MRSRDLRPGDCALGIMLAVLFFLLLVAAGAAFAESGMMGVGRMMGPGNDSSAPGGGFAILTESNSPLTTESNSVLVTENHP